MKINFYNTSTLDCHVVNVRGGLLEEVLTQAQSEVPGFTFDEPLARNGNVMSFPGFVADIVYFGVPSSERPQGRPKADWTERIEKFKSVYKTTLTAKQVEIKSGLKTSEVYYLSRMLDMPLAKAQRGRRKKGR